MTQGHGDTDPSNSGGATSAAAAAGNSGGEEIEHWWQAKGLPWNKKPTREEIACFFAYAGIGVYAFILMPFRPQLMAADPLWLVIANGSRTALVGIGGLLATEGYDLWLLAIVVGAISIIKFDPIYWWAGRLWGDAFLAIAAVDTSEKGLARRRKIQDFTRRNLFWAVLITHLPIPFPDLVVGVAAGASGVSLKRYMVYDFLIALPVRAAYVYAGFVFKDQAMFMVKAVEKYSLYMSLAIVVGMVITIVVNRRRAARRTQTV